MFQKAKAYFALLGPGILMAGAAVGVSHLVQSTRAGADFGFSLLWLVILVNLLKYPFFEFAHRYTASTGKSLIEGYQEMGSFYLASFFMLNIITALGSITAVFFVTASLLVNLLNLGDVPLYLIIAGLMAFCFAIYVMGHYRWLDILMKFLMVILFISTSVAFCLALLKGGVQPSADFVSKSPWNMASLPFILALLGWMPGPLEMSAWQSLWMEAKSRDTGKKPNMKEARLDFNTGYILCIILAIMFLAMGALSMHGSGEEFSNKAGLFAGQVVNLYTGAIGEFAAPIIAVAAFATMFSTSFTLLDAYPRALAFSLKILLQGKFQGELQNKLKGKNGTKHNVNVIKYVITTLCCIFAIYISYNTKNFKLLIDTVTITAFLAGPFFAILNYRLIFSALTPVEAKPSKLLHITSIIGIIFMASFALIFAISKIMQAL